jgi:uncharacterized protein YjdB
LLKESLPGESARSMTHASLPQRRPMAGVRRADLWAALLVVAACGSATTDEVTPSEVASVAVSPPTSTVSIGAQLPLRVIVEDAIGDTITNIDVHWSVQDPTIATVSTTGVVTGVKLGSTQVAASAAGKSGIGTVTVEKTPVSKVVVTPSQVDAAPGAQKQLTATALDAAQNPLAGRAVTWSTSNAEVAKVDANGNVSAMAAGTATITATSEGKSGAATVTVSPGSVASVAVTPSPLSMSVGQTTQLAVTLKDAVGNVLNGRTVSWSSSSSTVATVSAEGMVTAVAPGNATITASSEGKMGTASLTIAKLAVGSVTVDPQGPMLVLGANAHLTATVRDVNGNVVTDRQVTWSSSNTGVATVSASGVVNSVALGTATITATSEGKSGSTVVTVIPTPIATITLTPSTKTILAGETASFTATAKDASGNVLSGRVLVWTSSNPTVASVSSTGVATATGVGSTTITATAPLEGKSGSATLTVNAASVSVTPSPDSTYVGQTATLTAIAKDTHGNPVPAQGFAWSSNNTGLATVSQTGVVRGVAAGSATITATLTGQSGQAAFKVLAPVATVTVSPANPAAISVGQSITLQATLKDAANKVIGPGRVVTWTATNNAIVSITPVAGTYSITVRASQVGTVTITATSEGKTGTATVTVKR